MKVMVSGEMAGIKQAGHEVQQLTDLMEQYHSLSKLYETKPKGSIRKEKTFVESSSEFPKEQVFLDKVRHSKRNAIPKPMPPAVQRKGRKLNLSSSRENGKNSGKASKKQGKELTSKLHSGKDIGVKVYRLKASTSEEHAKQSVPMSEDDVKYSFHQPPQIAITSEATLYHKALTSSRKYVNLNNRNHTINLHHRDSGSGKSDGLFRLNRANTISDYKFESSKTQKDFEANRNGYSNGMFAEGNSDIFALDISGTIELNGRDPISKEIPKRSNGQRNFHSKTKKNAITRTSLRPPVTGSTPVLSNIPEGSTSRNNAEEIFERNLKKATEKITDDDFIINNVAGNIASFLKMPKFVRSNEEIDAAHSYMQSGRILQERGQNLSATSYYISMHPHVGSLSVSDQLGYSPDSRISVGNELLGRPPTPGNTHLSKKKPFSSPMNGSTSPQSPLPKIMESSRSFPVATLQKESNSKSKDTDLKKQQRKQLARSKGKIRKLTLKDPNLETCVQGRSLTQGLNGEGSAESPVCEIDNELEETKTKVRREKSKSGGSSKKGSGKKMIEYTQPIFDVCESFVIRSKQPTHQKLSHNSPDMHEAHMSKQLDKPKKLSPLTKLNTEMRRSKFILARTEKNLNDLHHGDVRLVSDPVSFSVRHPSYVSSYAHEEVRKSLPKPSRNVLLGKGKETDRFEDETDDAVLVFYHHENPTRKSSHVEPMSNHNAVVNGAIPELDELNLLEDSVVEKTIKTKKLEKSEFGNFVEASKQRKTALYDGGINDNMPRQSKIALTRLERLQNDRATFLRLVEQEFLKDPDHVTHQSVASFVDIKRELHPPSLSSMWKKFASNEIAQKPSSYAMFSSQYPVKHDGAEEKRVKIENTETQVSKNKQLAFRLNYVLPSSPSRRYTFPFGLPIKPLIKPVKSVSSGSDCSGTKSLSITELNLEINPDDRHKHFFMPNLDRSVKSLKPKHSSDNEAEEPDAIHSTLLTLPEIQRSQFLSGVSQDQWVNDKNSDVYGYIDPNSAAILPDSSATYRFAHDVSFDEGSRYRTTDLHSGFKANASDHGLNGLSRQFTSAIAMRHNDNGRLDLRISGREHSSNGNHSTAKDAASLSMVKTDDKCELPPTLSPTSPSMSAAIAASTSNSSFMPPPSASRPNVSSSNSAPSNNITFRLHKEKQNWNSRLGDLSVNGGGYSHSLQGPNTDPKGDIEPVLRMNMTSAIQRNLQTRERALAAAPKSRISSRYSNKNGSAGSEPNYADPCIAAQPSYQQRLMDLSLLESETVKYERNRKLKRKKNQDKDT